MLAYGTQVVAGVTPGAAARSFEADGPDRARCSTPWHDAVKQTGANASVIFVPPAGAADAILEAADAGCRSWCASPRASR
jgi:succinyl-CoA synthetase alpha subunit